MEAFVVVQKSFFMLELLSKRVSWSVGKFINFLRLKALSCIGSSFCLLKLSWWLKNLSKNFSGMSRKSKVCLSILSWPEAFSLKL
jgi:hypothetical protein